MKRYTYNTKKNVAKLVDKIILAYPELKGTWNEKEQWFEDPKITIFHNMKDKMWIELEDNFEENKIKTIIEEVDPPKTTLTKIKDLFK